MKPNPLPKEGCTDQEQIAFLSTHIENQNELIAQLKKDAEDNATAKQERAWAVDIATRFFVKDQKPDVDTMVKTAERLLAYTQKGTA